MLNFQFYIGSSISQLSVQKEVIGAPKVSSIPVQLPTAEDPSSKGISSKLQVFLSFFKGYNIYT